jgi:phosphate transport system substrate-binding protein
MKKSIFALALVSAPAFSQSVTPSPSRQPATAGVIALQGSDTLAGFMSDIIVSSGLEEQMVYQGGGSGKGEIAIAAGLQGLAPMSRKIKPEFVATAEKAGIEIIEHVIGLDGVGLFVNAQNTTKQLDLTQVVDIYSCKITNWKQIGGEDAPIVVYRRDDFSGTTDTFKSLTGLKEFGACVTILKETSDIAVATSTEANAIAYAGLSAGRPENHALSLAKSSADKYFSPTPANIRSFKYPLARTLYVYEAAGKYSKKEAETQLLANIIDRSFADPILVDNEFFTVD